MMDNNTESASIEELFNEAFLTKYTNFSSYAELISHPLFEKYASIEDVPEEEMDAFVVETTKFKNWLNMVGKARLDYFKNQLGY